MATSLSNETSTTSLLELSSNSMPSGIPNQDCSTLGFAKGQMAMARSESTGIGTNTQGANVTTSSN